MIVSRRPDITDEEIGMRAFRLRKERAEERALEKIRQGLKNQWSKFTVSEINLLGWVLGEVWAYVARGEWEQLAFSSMTREKANQIIEIAKDIVSHKKVGTAGLEEIYDLLKPAETKP